MRGKVAVLAVAAGVFAAGGHQAVLASGHGGKTAVAAIAYARAQIGKPYLWGGTGPDAFDCSGLVYMAYRQSIARTSQDQWRTEPHVTDPQPGDLVFFAGSDGTVTSPGHVGLVIGGGKMIEAYATGVPIRVASYAGRNPVGFTDPAAGARTA